MAHEWKTYSIEAYETTFLRAMRDFVEEYGRRLRRYRHVVDGPWLEGPPPSTVVVVVEDDDGGRFARRYRFPVGFRQHPRGLARLFANDAVGRLPVEHDEAPRARDEVWRDLRSLGWPKSPWGVAATISDASGERRLSGTLTIEVRADQTIDVFVGGQPAFAFDPARFERTSLWTTDGNSLFPLRIDLRDARVEFRDS